DVKLCRRTDERRVSAVRQPDQVVTGAFVHELLGLGKQLGVVWLGRGSYGPGSKDPPRDAAVLRIGLIMSDTGPAGAVAHQDDPARYQLQSVVNPSGDISLILAGDAPVPAAPYSLPEKCVFLNVPDVVHARIDRDGWKPSLRQRPPDSNVARGVEIRSPTVHLDDRQRLRWRARGSKEDTAADNIVCGANVDQLLREFAWLLVLRMK